MAAFSRQRAKESWNIGLYYIDLTVNGLIFGGIYALTAVGLTLVYGLLRVLHIAHAAVYTFGAFITVVVANATGSIAFGIVVAMAASALLGAAIYRLLYEPLLRHPPYVAMIASMGLSSSCRTAIAWCSASRV